LRLETRYSVLYVYSWQQESGPGFFFKQFSNIVCMYVCSYVHIAIWASLSVLLITYYIRGMSQKSRSLFCIKS
jgi:hypothetical protein